MPYLSPETTAATLAAIRTFAAATGSNLTFPDAPPPDGDEASDERCAFLDLVVDLLHLAEARGYGGDEVLAYAAETFPAERDGTADG